MDGVYGKEWGFVDIQFHFAELWKIIYFENNPHAALLHLLWYCSILKLLEMTKF